MSATSAEMTKEESYRHDQKIIQEYLDDTQKILDSFMADTQGIGAKILTGTYDSETNFARTREAIQSFESNSAFRDTESVDDIVDETEEEAIRKAVEEKNCW